MDIVNVYGHLADKSKIVIGVGNYNSVHGLACYFTDGNTLQIQSLPQLVSTEILELTLNYETSDNKTPKFSLSFGNKYIGARSTGDITTAIVTTDKTLFTLDYSIIDHNPRSKLMAGVLYCLSTEINGKKHIISWNINGFANGDLIMFLPTTWYQKVNGICIEHNGVNNLLNSINQLQFKGYTTLPWCQNHDYVTNCPDGTNCGDCIGKCKNNNFICWPDNNTFICGPHNKEPNYLENSLITMAEPPNQQTSTGGTAATWLALSIILILAIVLALFFTKNF